MKNIFIEYPKCSTCKKAKKWLEENNIEFIDRNIVEEIPTVKELEEWINCSEQNIKKWFNTSGVKYKELNLKEKLTTMSDKEKIKLLASDGMLIKRPLLISNKGITTQKKANIYQLNILLLSLYIKYITMPRKTNPITKKILLIFALLSAKSNKPNRQ